MKTAFVIYCRAMGLFAILMLPGIALSSMYLFSLKYVVLYGWLAWFVFTIMYLIIDRFLYDLFFKLSSLFIAVVIAVAFAYKMIGLIEDVNDLWVSKSIIFPFAAIVAGWISLCFSVERIKHSSAS